MKKYYTLLGIGVLISGISSASSLSAAETKVGVVAASNPAAYASGASTDKRVLQLGNNINFQEVINTDTKGSTQILFLDRSALTVGQNSSVTIDKFVYDPDRATGQLVMNATKGAFRFVGGALSKEKAVVFKTPVSTVGIRGGIAIVEVDPVSGATDAIFAYGKEMTIQNMAGDIQTTTVPGSRITVATAFSPPTPPVKVEPQAMMEKLEKLESQEGQNGGATQIPSSKEVAAVTTATESGGGSNGGGGGSTASSSQSGGSSEKSSTTASSTSNSGGNTPTTPATQAIIASDTPWLLNTRTPEGTKDAQKKSGDINSNPSVLATAKVGDKPAIDVLQEKGNSDPGLTQRASNITTSIIASSGNDSGSSNDVSQGNTTTTGNENGNGNSADTASDDTAGTDSTDTGNTDTDSSSSGDTSGGGSSGGSSDSSDSGSGGASGGSSGGSDGGSVVVAPPVTGPMMNPTGVASNWTSYLNDTDATAINHTNQVLLLDNTQRARCTTCNYVDWGVWSADVSDVTAPVDLSAVNLRVGGYVTQGLGTLIGSVIQPNSVDYNGIMVGNMKDVAAGSTTHYQDGTFNAKVNFGKRDLTDFSGNFAGRQFGFANKANRLPFLGKVTYSNLAVTAQDGGAPITGTINGALFGPAGEEMGGGFNIQTTGASNQALQGSGVYVGHKQ